MWYIVRMMKSLFASILISSFTLPAFAFDGILQKYVSEAEIYEIANHGPRHAQIQGTAVRLDTRDHLRCQQMKSLIQQSNGKISNVALADLCKIKAENPYKDIIVLNTEENEELLNYIKSGLTVGISAYDTNKSNKSKSNSGDDSTSSNRNRELLVSPLFAAVVSESIDRLRSYVKENRGKALNSQFLGSTILVVTNPAKTVGDIVNGFADYRFVQEAKTKVVLRDYRDEETFGRQKGSPQLNALEFKLEFRFY